MAGHLRRSTPPLASPRERSARSGVFFHASPAGKVTGPLTDQAGGTPAFNDPKIQENAAEAIHRFIPVTDEPTDARQTWMGEVSFDADTRH